MEWLFNGLGTTVIGVIIGAFAAGKIVQINIPYVNYFYRWKENKFIKTYTSLCQFYEVGKFKWPAANFYNITPHSWFNNVYYVIAGNPSFEGTGSDIFSHTKCSFLVRCFPNKTGQKQEAKKQMKALRFWHKTKTLRDKIANIVKVESKEKQQVLVIYQSDDNYTIMPNSNIPNADKSISVKGEFSLLFVFYLTDKTEIYRINNAKILQKGLNPSLDDKTTYFYFYKAKLEEIWKPTGGSHFFWLFREYSGKLKKNSKIGEWKEQIRHGNCTRT